MIVSYHRLDLLEREREQDPNLRRCETARASHQPSIHPPHNDPTGTIVSTGVHGPDPDSGVFLDRRGGIVLYCTVLHSKYMESIKHK
jgi:hypothetical protein